MIGSLKKSGVANRQAGKGWAGLPETERSLGRRKGKSSDKRGEETGSARQKRSSPT